MLRPIVAVPAVLPAVLAGTSMGAGPRRSMTIRPRRGRNMCSAA